MFSLSGKGCFYREMAVKLCVQGIVNSRLFLKGFTVEATDCLSGAILRISYAAQPVERRLGSIPVVITQNAYQGLLSAQQPVYLPDCIDIC